MDNLNNSPNGKTQQHRSDRSSLSHQHDIPAALMSDGLIPSTSYLVTPNHTPTKTLGKRRHYSAMSSNATFDHKYNIDSAYRTTTNNTSPNFLPVFESAYHKSPQHHHHHQHTEMRNEPQSNHLYSQPTSPHVQRAGERYTGHETTSTTTTTTHSHVPAPPLSISRVGPMGSHHDAATSYTAWDESGFSRHHHNHSPTSSPLLPLPGDGVDPYGHPKAGLDLPFAGFDGLGDDNDDEDDKFIFGATRTSFNPHMKTPHALGSPDIQLHPPASTPRLHSQDPQHQDFVPLPADPHRRRPSTPHTRSVDAALPHGRTPSIQLDTPPRPAARRSPLRHTTTISDAVSSMSSESLVSSNSESESHSDDPIPNRFLFHGDGLRRNQHHSDNHIDNHIGNHIGKPQSRTPLNVCHRADEDETGDETISEDFTASQSDNASSTGFDLSPSSSSPSDSGSDSGSSFSSSSSPSPTESDQPDLLYNVHEGEDDDDDDDETMRDTADEGSGAPLSSQVLVSTPSTTHTHSTHRETSPKDSRDPQRHQRHSGSTTQDYPPSRTKPASIRSIYPHGHPSAIATPFASLPYPSGRQQQQQQHGAMYPHNTPGSIGTSVGRHSALGQGSQQVLSHKPLSQISMGVQRSAISGYSAKSLSPRGSRTQEQQHLLRRPEGGGSRGGSAVSSSISHPQTDAQRPLSHAQSHAQRRPIQIAIDLKQPIFHLSSLGSSADQRGSGGPGGDGGGGQTTDYHEDFSFLSGVSQDSASASTNYSSSVSLPGHSRYPTLRRIHHTPGASQSHSSQFHVESQGEYDHDGESAAPQQPLPESHQPSALSARTPSQFGISRRYLSSLQPYSRQTTSMLSAPSGLLHHIHTQQQQQQQQLQPHTPHSAHSTHHTPRIPPSRGSTALRQMQVSSTGRPIPPSLRASYPGYITPQSNANGIALSSDDDDDDDDASEDIDNETDSDSQGGPSASDVVPRDRDDDDGFTTLDDDFTFDGDDYLGATTTMNETEDGSQYPSPQPTATTATQQRPHRFVRSVIPLGSLYSLSRLVVSDDDEGDNNDDDEDDDDDDDSDIDDDDDNDEDEDNELVDDVSIDFDTETAVDDSHDISPSHAESTLPSRQAGRDMFEKLLRDRLTQRIQPASESTTEGLQIDPPGIRSLSHVVDHADKKDHVDDTDHDGNDELYTLSSDDERQLLLTRAFDDTNVERTEKIRRTLVLSKADRKALRNPVVPDSLRHHHHPATPRQLSGASTPPKTMLVTPRDAEAPTQGLSSTKTKTKATTKGKAKPTPLPTAFSQPSDDESCIEIPQAHHPATKRQRTHPPKTISITIPAHDGRDPPHTAHPAHTGGVSMEPIELLDETDYDQSGLDMTIAAPVIAPKDLSYDERKRHYSRKQQSDINQSKFRSGEEGENEEQQHPHHLLDSTSYDDNDLPTIIMPPHTTTTYPRISLKTESPPPVKREPLTSLVSHRYQPTQHVHVTPPLLFPSTIRSYSLEIDRFERLMRLSTHQSSDGGIQHSFIQSNFEHYPHLFSGLPRSYLYANKLPSLLHTKFRDFFALPNVVLLSMFGSSFVPPLSGQQAETSPQYHSLHTLTLHLVQQLIIRAVESLYSEQSVDWFTLLHHLETPPSSLLPPPLQEQHPFLSSVRAADNSSWKPTPQVHSHPHPHPYNPSAPSFSSPAVPGHHPGPAGSARPTQLLKKVYGTMHPLTYEEIITQQNTHTLTKELRQAIQQARYQLLSSSSSSSHHHQQHDIDIFSFLNPIEMHNAFTFLDNRTANLFDTFFPLNHSQFRTIDASLAASLDTANAAMSITTLSSQDTEDLATEVIKSLISTTDGGSDRGVGGMSSTLHSSTSHSHPTGSVNYVESNRLRTLYLAERNRHLIREKYGLVPNLIHTTENNIDLSRRFLAYFLANIADRGYIPPTNDRYHRIFYKILQRHFGYKVLRSSYPSQLLQLTSPDLLQTLLQHYGDQETPFLSMVQQQLKNNPLASVVTIDPSVPVLPSPSVTPFPSWRHNTRAASHAPKISFALDTPGGLVSPEPSSTGAGRDRLMQTPPPTAFHESPFVPASSSALHQTTVSASPGTLIHYQYPAAQPVSALFIEDHRVMQLYETTTPVTHTLLSLISSSYIDTMVRMLHKFVRRMPATTSERERSQTVGYQHPFRVSKAQWRTISALSGIQALSQTHVTDSITHVAEPLPLGSTSDTIYRSLIHMQTAMVPYNPHILLNWKTQVIKWALGGPAISPRSHRRRDRRRHTRSPSRGRLENLSERDTASPSPTPIVPSSTPTVLPRQQRNQEDALEAIMARADEALSRDWSTLLQSRSMGDADHNPDTLQDMSSASPTGNSSAQSPMMTLDPLATSSVSTAIDNYVFTHRRYLSRSTRLFNLIGTSMITIQSPAEIKEVTALALWSPVQRQYLAYQVCALTQLRLQLQYLFYHSMCGLTLSSSRPSMPLITATTTPSSSHRMNHPQQHPMSLYDTTPRTASTIQLTSSISVAILPSIHASLRHRQHDDHQNLPRFARSCVYELYNATSLEPSFLLQYHQLSQYTSFYDILYSYHKYNMHCFHPSSLQGRDGFQGNNSHTPYDALPTSFPGIYINRIGHSLKSSIERLSQQSHSQQAEAEQQLPSALASTAMESGISSQHLHNHSVAYDDPATSTPPLLPSFFQYLLTVSFQSRFTVMTWTDYLAHVEHSREADHHSDSDRDGHISHNTSHNTPHGQTDILLSTRLQSFPGLSSPPAQSRAEMVLQLNNDQFKTINTSTLSKQNVSGVTQPGHHDTTNATRQSTSTSTSCMMSTDLVSQHSQLFNGLPFMLSQAHCPWSAGSDAAGDNINGDTDDAAGVGSSYTIPGPISPISPSFPYQYYQGHYLPSTSDLQHQQTRLFLPIVVLSHPSSPSPSPTSSLLNDHRPVSCVSVIPIIPCLHIFRVMATSMTLQTMLSSRHLYIYGTYNAEHYETKQLTPPSAKAMDKFAMTETASLRMEQRRKGRAFDAQGTLQAGHAVFKDLIASIRRVCWRKSVYHSTSHLYGAQASDIATIPDTQPEPEEQPKRKRGRPPKYAPPSIVSVSFNEFDMTSSPAIGEAPPTSPFLGKLQALERSLLARLNTVQKRTRPGSSANTRSRRQPTEIDSDVTTDDSDGVSSRAASNHSIAPMEAITTTTTVQPVPVQLTTTQAGDPDHTAATSSDPISILESAVEILSQFRKSYAAALRRSHNARYACTLSPHERVELSSQSVLIPKQRKQQSTTTTTKAPGRRGRKAIYSKNLPAGQDETQADPDGVDDDSQDGSIHDDGRNTLTKRSVMRRTRILIDEEYNSSSGIIPHLGYAEQSQSVFYDTVAMIYLICSPNHSTTVLFPIWNTNITMYPQSLPNSLHSFFTVPVEQHITLFDAIILATTKQTSISLPVLRQRSDLSITDYARLLYSPLMKWDASMASCQPVPLSSYHFITPPSLPLSMLVPANHGGSTTARWLNEFSRDDTMSQSLSPHEKDIRSRFLSSQKPQSASDSSWLAPLPPPSAGDVILGENKSELIDTSAASRAGASRCWTLLCQGQCVCHVNPILLTVDIQHEGGSPSDDSSPTPRTMYGLAFDSFESFYISERSASNPSFHRKQCTSEREQQPSSSQQPDSSQDETTYHALVDTTLRMLTSPSGSGSGSTSAVYPCYEVSKSTLLSSLGPMMDTIRHRLLHSSPQSLSYHCGSGHAISSSSYSSSLLSPYSHLLLDHSSMQPFCPHYTESSIPLLSPLTGDTLLTPLNQDNTTNTTDESNNPNHDVLPTFGVTMQPNINDYYFLQLRFALHLEHATATAPHHQHTATAARTIHNDVCLVTLCHELHEPGVMLPVQSLRNFFLALQPVEVSAIYGDFLLEQLTTPSHSTTTAPGDDLYSHPDREHSVTTTTTTTEMSDEDEMQPAILSSSFYHDIPCLVLNHMASRAMASAGATQPVFHTIPLLHIESISYEQSSHVHSSYEQSSHEQYSPEHCLNAQSDNGNDINNTIHVHPATFFLPPLYTIPKKLSPPPFSMRGDMEACTSPSQDSSTPVTSTSTSTTTTTATATARSIREYFSSLSSRLDQYILYIQDNISPCVTALFREDCQQKIYDMLSKSSPYTESSPLTLPVHTTFSLLLADDFSTTMTKIFMRTRDKLLGHSSSLATPYTSRISHTITCFTHYGHWGLQRDEMCLGTPVAHPHAPLHQFLNSFVSHLPQKQCCYCDHVSKGHSSLAIPLSGFDFCLSDAEMSLLQRGYEMYGSLKDIIFTNYLPGSNYILLQMASVPRSTPSTTNDGDSSPSAQPSLHIPLFLQSLLHLCHSLRVDSTDPKNAVIETDGAPTPSEDAAHGSHDDDDDDDNDDDDDDNAGGDDQSTTTLAKTTVNAAVVTNAVNSLLRYGTPTPVLLLAAPLDSIPQPTTGDESGRGYHPFIHVYPPSMGQSMHISAFIHCILPYANSDCISPPAERLLTPINQSVLDYFDHIILQQSSQDGSRPISSKVDDDPDRQLFYHQVPSPSPASNSPASYIYHTRKYVTDCNVFFFLSLIQQHHYHTHVKRPLQWRAQHRTQLYPSIHITITLPKIHQARHTHYTHHTHHYPSGRANGQAGYPSYLNARVAISHPSLLRSFPSASKSSETQLQSLSQAHHVQPPPHPRSYLIYPKPMAIITDLYYTLHFTSHSKQHRPAKHRRPQSSFSCPPAPSTAFNRAPPLLIHTIPSLTVTLRHLFPLPFILFGTVTQSLVDQLVYDCLIHPSRSAATTLDTTTYTPPSYYTTLDLISLAITPLETMFASSPWVPPHCCYLLLVLFHYIGPRYTLLANLVSLFQHYIDYACPWPDSDANQQQQQQGDAASAPSLPGLLKSFTLPLLETFLPVSRRGVIMRFKSIVHNERLPQYAFFLRAHPDHMYSDRLTPNRIAPTIRGLLTTAHTFYSSQYHGTMLSQADSSMVVPPRMDEAAQGNNLPQGGALPPPPLSGDHQGSPNFLPFLSTTAAVAAYGQDQVPISTTSQASSGLFLSPIGPALLSQPPLSVQPAALKPPIGSIPMSDTQAAQPQYTTVSAASLATAAVVVHGVTGSQTITTGAHIHSASMNTNAVSNIEPLRIPPMVAPLSNIGGHSGEAPNIPIIPTIPIPHIPLHHTTSIERRPPYSDESKSAHGQLSSLPTSTQLSSLPSSAQLSSLPTRTPLHPLPIQPNLAETRPDSAAHPALSRQSHAMGSYGLNTPGSQTSLMGGLFQNNSSPLSHAALLFQGQPTFVQRLSPLIPDLSRFAHEHFSRSPLAHHPGLSGSSHYHSKQRATADTAPSLTSKHLLVLSYYYFLYKLYTQANSHTLSSHSSTHQTSDYLSSARGPSESDESRLVHVLLQSHPQQLHGSDTARSTSSTLFSLKITPSIFTTLFPRLPFQHIKTPHFTLEYHEARSLTLLRLRRILLAMIAIDTSRASYLTFKKDQSFDYQMQTAFSHALDLLEDRAYLSFQWSISTSFASSLGLIPADARPEAADRGPNSLNSYDLSEAGEWTDEEYVWNEDEDDEDYEDEGAEVDEEEEEEEEDDVPNEAPGDDDNDDEPHTATDSRGMKDEDEMDFFDLIDFDSLLDDNDHSSINGDPLSIRTTVPDMTPPSPRHSPPNALVLASNPLLPVNFTIRDGRIVERSAMGVEIIDSDQPQHHFLSTNHEAEHPLGGHAGDGPQHDVISAAPAPETHLGLGTLNASQIPPHIYTLMTTDLFLRKLLRYNHSQQPSIIQTIQYMLLMNRMKQSTTHLSNTYNDSLVHFYNDYYRACSPQVKTNFFDILYFNINDYSLQDDDDDDHDNDGEDDQLYDSSTGMHHHHDRIQQQQHGHAYYLRKKIITRSKHKMLLSSATGGNDDNDIANAHVVADFSTLQETKAYLQTVLQCELQVNPIVEQKPFIVITESDYRLSHHTDVYNKLSLADPNLDSLRYQYRCQPNAPAGRPSEALDKYNPQQSQYRGYPSIPPYITLCEDQECDVSSHDDGDSGTSTGLEQNTASHSGVDEMTDLDHHLSDYDDEYEYEYEDEYDYDDTSMDEPQPHHTDGFIRSGNRYYFDSAIDHVYHEYYSQIYEQKALQQQREADRDEILPTRSGGLMKPILPRDHSSLRGSIRGESEHYTPPNEDDDEDDEYDFDLTD